MFALASLFLAAAPAGWTDLFPALGVMYDRKVSPPKVEKGEKPAAYSQAAEYGWTGGRDEHITVTIARDPAFKEKYSAEAMKKEKAEKLEIGKKTAYLSERLNAGPDNVNRWLVVILADDKVLLIEQKGAGMQLAEAAKKFDFEKVAKALENPPPK